MTHRRSRLSARCCAFFLFGRARSDGAESSGAGCRAFISVRDFLYESGAGAHCQGIHCATHAPRCSANESSPRWCHCTGFYKAEAYHQDYALHNPTIPYIEICDRPKIGELKKQFPDLFQNYEGK